MKKEKNNDLISVIVPVYNVEPYLKRCVDSIINQTYKNLEIILVDDGSNDKSGEMCDEYKKKDDRIVVIHKKNGGLSDARNKGIKKSTGKYITFVDSDDYISNKYVEYLYYLIKKYNCEIAITPHIVIRGKSEKNEGKNHVEEKISKITGLQRLLLNDGFSISSCGKMYHTKLFKNVEFPYGKLCEDVGTTYKVFNICDNIAYGNKANYFYNIRDNSITTANFNYKKLDLIDLTDEMCGFLNVNYPELEEYTFVRMVESRFSIIRQLLFTKKEEYVDCSNKYINYIKNNKKRILKNKHIGKRQKIALISLLVGKKFYIFSWRVYSFFR